MGNGWDINVVNMFFEHYRLHRLRQQQPKSKPVLRARAPTNREQQLKQLALVTMQKSMTTAEFADMLSDQTLDEQRLCLSLLHHHHSQGHAGSVLDSGSSRHISPQVQVLDHDSTISISGFDGSTA